MFVLFAIAQHPAMMYLNCLNFVSKLSLRLELLHFLWLWFALRSFTKFESPTNSSTIWLGQLSAHTGHSKIVRNGTGWWPNRKDQWGARNWRNPSAPNASGTASFLLHLMWQRFVQAGGLFGDTFCCNCIVWPDMTEAGWGKFTGQDQNQKASQARRGTRHGCKSQTLYTTIWRNSVTSSRLNKIIRHLLWGTRTRRRCLRCANGQRTHTPAHKCLHTHVNTHTHIHVYDIGVDSARSGQHTHTHTHTHMHTQTHTQQKYLWCAKWATHTHSHKHIHTHTHTHKRARTHTNTHGEGISGARSGQWACPRSQTSR